MNAHPICTRIHTVYIWVSFAKETYKRDYILQNPYSTHSYNTYECALNVHGQSSIVSFIGLFCKRDPHIYWMNECAYSVRASHIYRTKPFLAPSGCRTHCSGCRTRPPGRIWLLGRGACSDSLFYRSLLQKIPTYLLNEWVRILRPGGVFWYYSKCPVVFEIMVQIKQRGVQGSKVYPQAAPCAEWVTHVQCGAVRCSIVQCGAEWCSVFI